MGECLLASGLSICQSATSKLEGEEERSKTALPRTSRSARKARQSAHPKHLLGEFGEDPRLVRLRQVLEDCVDRFALGVADCAESRSCERADRRPG
jgi:hypothetical protein